MIEAQLILPFREEKPRENGLTILIDNGAPLNFFKDTIHSFNKYVDLVKFGWGTSVITDFLEEKITYLREHDVDFFFGGTLFEKYVSQEKVEAYFDFCKTINCQYVEISNGTIPLTNSEKASFITDFAKDFTVFSEVGHKDRFVSSQMESAQWLEYIQEDIEAGATKVITEARESGTSGLCEANGDIRINIFDEIIDSEIPLQRLIFEAPTKQMQTFFIKNVGSNVNLANVPLTDVIALETLRLGLRSDTFNLFKTEIIY